MSSPPALARRTSARLSSTTRISLSEDAIVRSYTSKAVIETKIVKTRRKRTQDDVDSDRDEEEEEEDEPVKKKMKKKPALVRSKSTPDGDLDMEDADSKPKKQKKPKLARAKSTPTADEDDDMDTEEKPKKKRIVRKTSKQMVERADSDGNVKLVRTTSTLKRVIIDLPKRSESEIAQTLAQFNTIPINDTGFPVPHRKKGKFIGAHISMAGAMGNAARNAAIIGATCFACDTKSKRKWDSPPYSQETIDDFKQACAEYGYQPEDILPHGSYLMNCGSSFPENLEKSRACLLDECQRCEQLGIRYYNFHPGNTNGEVSVETCLKTIAQSLNWVHKQTSFVVTVLENMAGQGNTVGGSFEHLKTIIDQVEDKSRVGVCLDTCHTFAAGYDISTAKGVADVLQQFDDIIGLQYLCGLHLNDSKRECGSHRDLHENIGKGHIGVETFRALMNDPRLDGIPLILETPVPEEKEGDKDAWKSVYGKEIKLLYGLIEK